MPSSSDDVPDKVVKAVARGDEEAVLAWLEGGGRVDATYERGGASGVTLLMSAAHHGHERVVDLLLRRGAEVNLQRSDGWTALMLAARYGHERVVELLIRHGAEVDQQDSIGYTALMAAALFNHPAVVLRLLRAGADTAARSASGNTALKMAKEKGHAECVEAFRQHIATVAGAAKAAAEAAATESAPRLSRWSTMLVGDRASIVGLAGRPALNGRRVRLLSWAGERSRWCAQLEGGGSEQLLIREENLCAVGCSKVECWGCGVMPEPTQSFKCCPICVEQKLATPAYFCSADCQKANWKDHKRWHKAQSDSQAGVRSMYAEDNPQRETSKEEAQAAPFLCKGTDVEEPAQLHARASVAMHKQDYREAAKLCRKAIARNQSSEILLAHSYHLLAVILTRSSDIVGACKSALKALTAPEQLQAQYRGLLASDYTETQLKASIEGWSQTWGMAFSLLRLVDCAALATPPWWNDSDLLRYSEAAILNRPTESEIDIFMSRAIILQGEPRVCRWLCAWAHDHRTAAQLYESARCFRKQAQLIPYMANQLPLDQCAASSERMAAMIAAMPARGASGEEEVLKQMLSKIDLASEVESFGRAFRQGTQVFVHGLQRKPELNGSPGLITGYDEATMRYHLMLTRFQGDTKEVALKEANLKQ